MLNKFFVALIVSLSFFISFANASIDPNLPYVPGRVIVKFNNTTVGSPVYKHFVGPVSTMTVKSALAGIAFAGADVRKELGNRNNSPVLVSLPVTATVMQSLGSFYNLRDTRYAEPDYIRRLFATTPDDPSFSTQWGLEKIQAEEAWDFTTGDVNVIVAVLDTGIDYTHPDFNDPCDANRMNLWTRFDGDGAYYGRDVAGAAIDDLTDADNDIIDTQSHGTHVAGIIGAMGNNAIGVSGVVWDVQLMGVKIFADDSEGAANSDIAVGIEWATDHGADIMNGSYGGYGYSQLQYDAIADAAAHGVIFVAAAGNDSTSTMMYPAAYDLDNIISVASTDSSDNLSSFSNYGSTWVDIAAPGSDIISCQPGNQYQGMSGTSMACPHVSGVAALIVSHHAGSITPSEVRNRLLTYVDDISSQNSGYIGQLGSGRLNAYAAITGTTPPEPPKTFCHSQGNNVNDEWIAGVTVGDFTNTSAGVGYQDFTDQTVDLVAGQSYDISLSPGFTSTAYNEYWKIWIDYNNDTTFTDDELAFDAGAISNTTVTGAINIPGDASGTVRMRVSMKYNGAQSACESFSYGEVEDYNVSITTGGPVDNPPTAPSNLAASNVTETTVDLNWTASTDDNSVAGYDVYQDGTFYSTVTGTNVTVTGLSEATTYSFYVIAKDDADQESDESNTVSVTTDEYVDDEAPTAPTGLAASNVAETTIDLNWTASTDNVGVTAYDVYMNGTFYATVVGTSANVTGLTASTTYSFYVVAKDAADNVSAQSNSVSVTTDEGNDVEAPTAPTSLAVSNVTETTVDLNWTASTDNVGVTAYDVYQDGSFYATVTETSANVTGLSEATTYSFYVVAKDAAGNVSAQSNSVSVTTDEGDDVEAPTAPTSLAASNVTETTVDLNWTASTDNVGVTGYDVYQDGSLYSSVTGTTVSVSGLTASTTYTFYIIAKDAAGNTSSASNTVSVTTDDTPSGDCYTSSVTLSLTFDNYPSETSWTLTDGSGSTVASGSGYSSKGATISEVFDL